jgi:hypothetical protein
MPYIHITNDNYEIPSISPSYYFLGNSVISNNTSKVLVFSFNRKLVDVINSRSENLEKNTFDLPQIFDGSTFSDSQLDIDDNFYDYYKKIIKYYKLRKNFKISEFGLGHTVSNPREDYSIDENFNTSINNKLPLLFKNDEFMKKISTIIPENQNFGKYDNFLGLWPNFKARPLPMPEVPENIGVGRLFNSRKNLPIKRKFGDFVFLDGIRSQKQTQFSSRLSPGVNFGLELDLFYDNDSTVRYLPEVEYGFGLSKFKNLEEYDISPSNISEQFWNEEDLTKKFQVIPSYKHKTKNGFIFYDRTAIDTVIKPILSGEDLPESNYNDTKYY